MDSLQQIFIAGAARDRLQGLQQAICNVEILFTARAFKRPHYVVVQSTIAGRHVIPREMVVREPVFILSFVRFRPE